VLFLLIDCRSMPIPIYNYPSDYDMHGSKRYDCDSYEYDEQEWIENALYKRRHDGLYCTETELEDQDTE